MEASHGIESPAAQPSALGTTQAADEGEVKAGKRKLYAAALLDDVDDLSKWADDELNHEVFRELNRADEEKSFIQRVDELRSDVSRIIRRLSRAEATRRDVVRWRSHRLT